MVLTARDFVPLDESRFRAIQNACDLLIRGLSIEQKFRLLVMNFLEFEDSLLAIANRYMILPEPALFERRMEPLFELSRRLVNLLTTCRLYIDQIKHDVRHQYGGTSGEFLQCKAAFSEEFDKRIGYRVMEELRNHTQHRGLPIHIFHQGSRRIEEHGKSEMEFYCGASATISRLKVEGGFKSKRLDELERIANSKGEFLLVPLVRDYISGIENAHRKVRSILSVDLAAAEAVLLAAVSLYADVAGERCRSPDGVYYGLAAVCEEPDGVVVSESQLLLSIIDERKALDGVMFDLTKCFASSRAVV